MSSSAAAVVARTFALSSLYHRRRGLVLAGFALATCIGIIFSDETPQKAGLLAATALLGYGAIQAIKLSMRYLDPAGSPVLEALAHDRAAIVQLKEERHGKRLEAVLVHKTGAQLTLHLRRGSGEAEFQELLAALRTVLPLPGLEPTQEEDAEGAEDAESGLSSASNAPDQ